MSTMSWQLDTPLTPCDGGLRGRWPYPAVCPLFVLAPAAGPKARLRPPALIEDRTALPARFLLVDPLALPASTRKTDSPPPRSPAASG